MRSLCYFIIPDRKLASSPDGTAFTIPALAAGQDWDLAFRFLDRVDGSLVEVAPYVRSVVASIGAIDARPDAGQFALKITADAESEANTTALLDRNIGQKKFEEALNALSGKPADIKVCQVPDGWVIYREDGGTLTLSVVENTLRPIAFADIEGWQEGDSWFYEIRLKQAPIAFTDSSARVDPAAPTIEAVADGGESGGFYYNEIQKLIIPTDFRGGYIIRNSVTLARTKRLDNTDDQASLTEALTALMGDTVTVSDSEVPGVGYIEFNGDTLAGVDQPLLTVEVIDTPRGDVTISIPLRRPELHAALRTTKTLKAQPFELSFELVESLADETDPDAPAKVHTTSGLTVTITRQISWNLLAQVAGVDWLLPPKDKTLLRWTADQVAQGVQHYVTAIGDGATLSPIVAHNLATEDIAHVLVFDQSSRACLSQGTDYTFAITNENAITVTFPSAPTLDQHKIVITAAVPITAFAGHTHDTAQISRESVALDDILDDLGSRVQTLEAINSSIGTIATATQASGTGFRLPQLAEVLFYQGDQAAIFNTLTQTPVARGVVAAGAAALINEQLSGIAALLNGVAPFMLPACHQATPTNVTALPAPSEGAVWMNNAAPVLRLKGGGILIGAPKNIAQNEFIASDGRILFKATRGGTTQSYYPTAFERELWRISVNDKQLAVNRTLDAQFGLALQLVNAESNAQWVLVIERGIAPQDGEKVAAASFGTPAVLGTAVRTGTYNGRGVYTIGAYTIFYGDDGTWIGELTSEYPGISDNRWSFASTSAEPYGTYTNNGTYTAPLTVSTAASSDGLNLQNVIWDTATPILAQRLILTPVMETHSFGVRINRAVVSAVDTITMDTMLYGVWSGADTLAPASANFALRARLINFDTENDLEETARGWVTYQVIGPGGLNPDGTALDVPAATIA